MKFYNASFFCDKDTHLEVSIEKRTKKEDDQGWNITLMIKEDKYFDSPSITLFMTEDVLYKFLRSIDRETERLAEEDLRATNFEGRTTDNE